MASTPGTVDEIADRVFNAGLGMMETLSIHLGDRLGWYRALAERGPLTASALAEATGTDERYAREWLEQQAVSGLLLAHAAPGDDAAGRTFSISDAAAEVLTDERSLSYLAPLARAVTAAAARMPELLAAYRTGGGVGWAAYGDDMREAQSDMNRPWFEGRLATALRSVPALAAKLDRDGVRIAEVGFGGGWASIALARAL
ncbi:MAG: SAM-dependent methyltransferase, partial [Agromyces sp.]